MKPEIEVLLNALKQAHEKYLESVKQFHSAEDVEFHTKESNERFARLLKEIEDKDFDIPLIEKSIELLGVAVIDAENDRKEAEGMGARFAKGLCSRGCLDRLLREYVKSVVSVMAAKELEPILTPTCDMLTSHVSEAVLEMLVLAQSDKNVEETRKEAHSKIANTHKVLETITTAIREGSFEVVDLRGKDNKVQYN